MIAAQRGAHSAVPIRAAPTFNFTLPTCCQAEVPRQQHPPGLGAQQREQPLQGGHSIRLCPLTPKVPNALQLAGGLWYRSCVRELHSCCHGQLEALLTHLQQGMGPLS